ncbi:MAG TPA: penicillin acylase family protein [Symbiobacteriaceae bacterium]|nr:penicillin acylase family protein [Symbiobacteriaceae bacterium]
MFVAAISQPAPTPAPERRPRRRWLRYVALALVALVVIVAGGGYLFLRRSLPQVTGELNLKGLGAPVTVTRDERGIPHIEAQTEVDLFRAQGYVTAQDRLWEMDLTRRAVAGRLAEVMGAGMLSTDKFFRTLTLRRAAEASVPELSAETVSILTAYAEGVNAFIAQAVAAGSLSPEFTLLGYQPEPWSIVDSLSIGKYMAYDMNGDQMESEIFRYQIRQAVGDQLTSQLVPAYPEDGVTIMKAAAGTAAKKAAFAPMPADDSQIDVSGLMAAAVWPEEFVGSNNWVISGRLTATGKPLLANDPHLSLRTPSIWYQSHLMVKGGLNVIGVTIPGAPGLILGHNEKIAWGMTNTDPDVLDLYMERRNPANPYQFEYMGTWEDATVHKESIKVKGQADVPLEIVVTRHGPIVSEVGGTAENRPQEALAAKWTAHMPSREIEAVLAFDRAQNWQEFRQALQLFKGPTQNFVFAAVDGTIAYHAGGMVPIRNQGDGMVPVPGWVDTYEWTSFIPFDEMPEVVNPAEGFISTANNKAVDDAYPYFLTYAWAQPYRATRIREELTAKGGQFTADDMQKLQTDYLDLQARWLVPVLLKQMGSATLTAQEQKALALIQSWDFADSADKGAPLVYHAWWDQLTKLLYEPKMGEDLYGQMTDKGLITDAILRQAVAGQPNEWVTAAGGLAKLAQDSFKATVADLASRFGSDPHKWTWGEFHRIGPAHPIGAEVAALGWLLNPRSQAVSGSGLTVGAMGFNRSTGNVNLAAPWRHVVDFADIQGNSRDILNPGQAGHPLSPWYTSQADQHVAGALQPMLMKPAAYASGKKLTLKP